MTAWLRSHGYPVNRKRVAWLLQIMEFEMMYPKPRLSQPHSAHRVSPYSLREMPITRVNHVWSTDITSIWLQGGSISLVAVLEWCSRYVLSWAVSITMDVGAVWRR